MSLSPLEISQQNSRNIRLRLAIQRYILAMPRRSVVQNFGSRDSDSMLSSSATDASNTSVRGHQGPPRQNLALSGISSDTISAPPRIPSYPIASSPTYADWVEWDSSHPQPWHESPFVPLVQPDGRPASYHVPDPLQLQRASSMSRGSRQGYASSLNYPHATPSTSNIPVLESFPTQSHTVHWHTATPPAFSPIPVQSDSSTHVPGGVLRGAPTAQNNILVYNTRVGGPVTSTIGSRLRLPYARPPGGILENNDRSSMSVAVLGATISSSTITATNPRVVVQRHPFQHQAEQRRAAMQQRLQALRQRHEEVSVGGERIPVDQQMHTRVSRTPNYMQRLRSLQVGNAELRRRESYVAAEGGYATLLQFIDPGAIFMHTVDGEPKLIVEADVIAAIAVDSQLLKFENQFPQSDECIICLEEYELQQDVRVLSCNHTHRFHKHCIDKWLTKNKPNCPICRQILPSLNPPKETTPLVDHPMQDLSVVMPSSIVSSTHPNT